MKDNLGNLIYVGCSIAYIDVLHKMREGIVTFIDADKIYINHKFRISAEEVVVLL